MPLLRPVLALLVLGLLLPGCTTWHRQAPSFVESDGTLARRHYQAEIVTEDNVKLRFTVFQPALRPGETAPLLIQAHPFGLWRVSRPHTLLSHALTSGKVLREAWAKGYWVISFDERGHGDSGDVMHIADPQREGRDVTRLIDWAQKNLALATVDGDPRVGMIGESYGAGIQLVAAAVDPRIDAIVPIGGWYDLERVLAPGDVPKSGWLTILVLAGNTIADYDNRLNGAYWRARSGHIEPWVRAELDDNDVGWFCDRGRGPKVDALVFQGFRDVLFPVNEGLDIHRCLKAAGRDVRFVAVDDGHLLPGTQRSPGWLVGWNVEKELACDGRRQKTADVMLAWFEAKLRDRDQELAKVPVWCLTGDPAVDAAGAPPAPVRFGLAKAEIGSGVSGMLEWAARPLDHVGNWFVPARLPADWQAPRNGGLRPARIPLAVMDKATWVAGVPRVTLTVSDTDREDAVVFLRLAAWRPGSGTYRALSEQVTPVRGAGTRTFDLMAVRGLLQPGEVLGLIAQGYNAQYRFSGSGLGTDAAVSGSIEIPMAPAAATR